MQKHKKRLGQHFLHDKNIINKIIKNLKINTKDTFIEIGPGEGALTTPLLKEARSIVLIEKDKDLIPILEKKYDDKKVKIINKDILKCELSNLIKKNMRIVGNLPYNISTEIIFRLLIFSKDIKDLHFMLQKEVVDRMVAEPGSKTYGRLSIMTQVYFNISKLFDISPNVFTPRPKVQSSYIRMLPRVSLFESTMYESKFKKLVTLAFTARRKMIKTSFKDYLSESDLRDLSINPNSRPEMLSVRDFLKIANNV